MGPGLQRGCQGPGARAGTELVLSWGGPCGEDLGAACGPFICGVLSQPVLMDSGRGQDTQVNSNEPLIFQQDACCGPEHFLLMDGGKENVTTVSAWHRATLGCLTHSRCLLF